MAKTRKISLTIDERALADFDKMCDEIGLTRSAFFTLAGRAYLDQKSAMKAISDVNELMDKLRESGMLENKTTGKVIE